MIIKEITNINNIHKKLIFVFKTLIVCLITIGCMNNSSFRNYNYVDLHNCSEKDIRVWGEYDSEIYKRIIFVDTTNNKIYEANLYSDNKFEVILRPSVYNILAKISGISELQLVKKSLQIVENVTINLLNVKLVPIPIFKSVEVINITKDSVTIRCETSVESEVRIDYGTSPAFNYSTYTDTALKNSHTIQITGLFPATTYYYRVVATRYGIPETESYSQTYNFTTEAN